MSENWKPGDAEFAQIAWTSTSGRHGGNGLALRCSDSYDESHWRTQAFGIIPDAWVTDVRRLVVIDPEDREQVERLVETIRIEADKGDRRVIVGGYVDAVQAALREFANPTPPTEPTDPKARVTDRRENVWRLLADGDWVCTSGPDVGEYLVWWQLAERGQLEVEVSA